MKTLICICITMTSFLIQTPQLFCQSQGLNYGSALFYGKIDGGEFREDSLFVNFTPDLMRTYSVSQLDNDTAFFVYPDSNGNFNFKLSGIREVGSFLLSLRGNKLLFGKSNVIFMNTAYPRYYVEPGDSIYMSIKIHGEGDFDNLISGRGSEKYLAMSSISNAMRLKPRENLQMRRKSADTDPLYKIERFKKISASRIYAQTSLLNYYKDDLSAMIYNLLYTDIHSIELRNMVSIIEDSYLRKKIEISLSSLVDHFPKTTSNLTPRSPYYIDYVIRRKILEHKINSKSSNYTLKDIYSSLKKENDTLLRQKSMISYLLNGTNRLSEFAQDHSGFDECVKDAYENIDLKIFSQDIEKKLSKYQNGQMAQNFMLTNVNGEIVELAKLQGKVVLIDIYSTICTGCRIFAKTLKDKVFPEFKDNSGVVFIAISIETDRDRWVQDIEDGHNTSKEHEIILHTGGLGLKHPYMRYYEIQAVPTLILIDKEGKIANSSSASLTVATSGEDIIKMIHKELQKKI